MGDTPWAEAAGMPIRDWTNGDDVDSDTGTLDPPYTGFHVNIGGTIKFNDRNGTATTLVVSPGTFYPYEVHRLWSSGHTTLTPADIWLGR